MRIPLTIHDFTVGDRVIWIERGVAYNGTVVYVPPAGLDVRVRPDMTSQEGALLCARLIKVPRDVNDNPIFSMADLHLEHIAHLFANPT